MPDPRRKTLLAAADTYPRSGAPENRLTEIFAEVLRTSPQLTAWLVERQFPELVNTVNGGGYRVTTQFSLDGGSQRPDMQIDLNGQYVYVENKLDAGLTAAQTAGYTAVKDPHVLMAIVRAGSDSEFRRLQDRFAVVTWEDVSAEAYKIGRDWGDRTWRLDALSPTAPGEYRLLVCRLGFSW